MAVATLTPGVYAVADSLRTTTPPFANNAIENRIEPRVAARAICPTSDIYFLRSGTIVSRLVVPLEKDGPWMSIVDKRPVVLVVEDDPLLRMDAIAMVEAAGFKAMEAAHADQAIAILEAHPNIHVVFTDIQMPGTMDGLKLARFVKDRWPPIKIVATSGRLKISKDDLPEGGVFVPKPYSPAQIANTLRELTTDV
jgi:CheY-like chemotaxis protein